MTINVVISSCIKAKAERIYSPVYFCSSFASV